MKKGFNIRAEDIASAQPAGMGRRLAAMLYDGFLIGAILIAVDALATFLYGDGIPAHTLWLQITNFSIIVLYYAYFWSKSGQTLGMQTWRIVAMDDDYQIMGFGQSILRAIIALPAILFLMVGFLIMYWDPNKKTIHERLSRSITLHYQAYKS